MILNNVTLKITYYDQNEYDVNIYITIWLCFTL